MTTNSNNCRVSSSKQNKNHWANGLIKTLNDPTKRVLEDDLVIVIRDAYPKAEHHYLVCPKSDISSIKNVKPKHLPLLKHMEGIAKKLVDNHNRKSFLIGYHAVPSMLRLHLHVISDDFNSKFLKTKKHWNSFNTEFFIRSEYLVKQLESGKLKHLSNIEAKKLLSADLKCHKCDYNAKNMPDLKHHILKHI